MSGGSLARSPPGATLNLLNWLVQLPVIAPLIQAVYWAVFCVLAPLLAPLVMLNGLREAVSDALAQEPDPDSRARLAVVVTGCDTGFGRALAIELAQRGYVVFAGCLKGTMDHQDMAVKGVPAERLHLCKMDVCKQAEVDATVERVREWVHAGSGRRVLSVTNNAGVGTGGPIDWLSMQDYERDMAVNFFGCVRVCQAFLPLLRLSSRAASAESCAPPRIVIVSSMSGKLPVPMLSTYASSKHAVAAFASCLRLELTDTWGVHVCTALPSFHRTPLTEGGVQTIRRLWDSLPRSTRATHGDASATSAFRVADQMMTDWAWDSARVTEALVRVNSQLRPPPAELTIGSDARLGLHVLRHLPPAIYEWVIGTWMLWDYVRPEAATQPETMLKED